MPALHDVQRNVVEMDAGAGAVQGAKVVARFSASMIWIGLPRVVWYWVWVLTGAASSR